MERVESEEWMMWEGCATPEHKIPAARECPPPPKKKVMILRRREAPKNGYFYHPDLELLFAVGSTDQAYTLA